MPRRRRDEIGRRIQISNREAEHPQHSCKARGDHTSRRLRSANRKGRARRPRQLAELLRGTKSADIPAEQPIKFDLAISLKAAKSRDLTVPAPLLATADKVIE